MAFLFVIFTARSFWLNLRKQLDPNRPQIKVRATLTPCDPRPPFVADLSSGPAVIDISEVFVSRYGGIQRADIGKNVDFARIGV